ncbi:hypothetical protein [Sinorhizobium saheli]|uniref:hypothetical protein n=1 Tax=Sinorhizobium saheli TaxID=36856 RepID=UPI0012948F49|nr:hypothetical protein [Sinorhizobium saheli]MQW88039.1 hypothetical protein [Sinorhizobium saheli]
MRSRYRSICLFCRICATSGDSPDCKMLQPFNGLGALGRCEPQSQASAAPEIRPRDSFQNFSQKTFEKPIDADAGFVVYAPHRMGV